MYILTTKFINNTRILKIKILMLIMKGLSNKEIQVVADLEFRKTYYFTASDILHHFNSKCQMINTLYTMKKKGRIVRLSKQKYFLIPIKARKGVWTDHPLIIADEMCNGQDYFIGGWFAANYWGLTDQIPFQVDIYTTKRQGKLHILNTHFLFRRTTHKKIREKSIIRKLKGHPFRILTKRDAQKWLKSHQ